MIEIYTSDDVDCARILATVAHKRQRYGSLPYTHHLAAVVNEINIRYGSHVCSELHKLKIIGYLHDILEDTDITYQILARCFGQTIAECVRLISDPKEGNRKERKAAANKKLESIKDADLYAALVVKAIDRYCNIRHALYKERKSLLQMYDKEQHDFYVAAYRPELCDDVWYDIHKLIELSRKFNYA